MSDYISSRLHKNINKGLKYHEILLEDNGNTPNVLVCALSLLESDAEGWEASPKVLEVLEKQKALMMKLLDVYYGHSHHNSSEGV